MPSIARSGDTVLSPDGQGKNCAFPVEVPIGAGPPEVNNRNVKVNGRLVPVQGNRVPPHQLVGCGLDLSVLTSFSTTVRIGGLGVARIGDRYGNNIITSGSGTDGSKPVFAGG